MGTVAPVISACQVCRHAALGYSLWWDFEEVHRLVQAWPGGPLTPDHSSFREWRRTEPHIRLEPCGHEQPEPEAVVIRFVEVDSAGQ